MTSFSWGTFLGRKSGTGRARAERRGKRNRQAARRNRRLGGTERLEERALLAVVTLSPNADTYVRAGTYANTNYGTTTTVNVRNHSTVSNDMEGFFRFDLSSVSGTIQGVTLKLTPQSVGADLATGNVRVRLLADAVDAWVEGNGGTNNNPVNEMTWNNHPTGAGNEVLVAGNLPVVNQRLSINVTSLVSQVSNANKVASFQLDIPTAATNRLVNFYSRSHSTTAYRPTLEVTTANAAPVANGDLLTLNEDAAATTVNVLANDSDPNGDALSVSAVTQGTKGAVAIVSGSVRYTPNANANGSDAFTYTVSDGQGGSAVGTVNVSITAVNDSPVAAADSVSTNFGTAVTVNVLANDSDVDGNSLSVSSVTSPANGTAVRNANNTVTYTPAAGYYGSDSFSYTVSDGNGGSATASVAVTVLTPPSVSINDVSVTEGNAGTTNATFTVSLSAAASGPVSVQYATRNGTAAAGSDYTSASGTLSFATGETAKTFTVAVLGDTTVEPNETILVDLLGLTGVIAGDVLGQATITNDDSAPPSGKRIVGYFPSWGVYGRDYHVNEIPADKLTHINYAFANIGADLRIALGDPYADIDRFYPGDCWDAGCLRGSFHQLQLLKQAHPHLRTMISVGGWTWSEKFSDVALTTASRQTFAQSAVQFIQQYGFDGIDVDWEYPVSGGESDNVNRPQDKQNYTLLMQELRSQLDVLEASQGRDYYLSIAAPAGPWTMQNLEIGPLAATLDWINVMTYDLHGGWDGRTGFNSPLYASAGDPLDPRLNADSAISAYLAAGAPAEKLVLGGAFYGRGWSNVAATNNGLWQPSSSVPAGTWEPGSFDYWDIAARFLPAGSGFTRYWRADAQVPWLYNPSTGVFISYDDPESLGIKADYINTRGLGGLMFWELSGDTADAQLLTAIHSRLGSGTSLPTLAINDVSVSEGNSGTTNALFTVTLSAASASPITVNYATAGSGSNPATAGSDFVSTSGTLTFAAGQTSRTISVVVNGDTTFEPAETFSITLSAASGATLADATGIATITNDDAAPLPTLSISDVSIVEGNPTTGASYLHTSGSQIVDAAGNNVKLAGVSWFGLETSNFAPHGLWARNWQSMMQQMQQQGFNTIRLPFSNQLFDAGSVPNGIDFGLNPDLVGQTGLQIMDKIVQYAGTLGLRVLLDHHRSDAGAGPNGNGLWHTAAYPESRWISDWTMLATRYANNPTVIGADLHNEPHGPATWGDGSANDWRLAAERGGNAVLAANPNWLIVVEGIENYAGQNYWWGGNLAGAGTHPVRLDVPGRLVYSPHDYPASVYPQSWFSDPTYPANLPAIWDAKWGYLFRNNIAPVLLGEFGSKLATTSDNQWAATIVKYLGGDFNLDNVSDLSPGQQGISWTWWSWNPNSGDTGGILADDWTTVLTAKTTLLDPIEFVLPSLPVTTTPATFTVTLSSASATPVTVAYTTSPGTASSSDFTATSGTLTFAPGETSKPVTVLVTRETSAESNETFTVTLSSPTNATLADATGLGTILDDDTPVPPSLSISDASVTEGHSGTTNAVFTVTLSASSATPVTVAYATRNDTALSPTDFTAVSGTLTFAPGETSKAITVPILGDTSIESTEQFFLDLSSATNATLLDALGLGTIVTDDFPPTSANVTWSTASVWDTGFTANVTIQNTSTQAWTDWIIEFDHPFNITGIWSAVILSRTGNRYRIRAEAWNRAVAPGASVSFGYQADPGNPTAPTNIVVTPTT